MDKEEKVLPKMPMKEDREEWVKIMDERMELP